MSLLPSNSTYLERVLEAAREQGIDPEVIRGVADSARCPPHFLPWLGWSLKVEGWEAANTEEQQRGLTREAIPIHKTKGTVGAIRRVLNAVRVNADYKDWREFPTRFRTHSSSPPGPTRTERVKARSSRRNWSSACAR